MTDLERIAPLFDGWQETMIWSCLQGEMGKADWNGDDTAARITSGDFCFLAGKPDRKLVETISVPIATARSEDWYALIEDVWGEKARRETRYAIKKEPEVFDREKLAGFVSALPEGYALRFIDKALYPALMAEGWSRDFCSNFEGPADFERRGLGVVAMYGDVPVAGASSYIVYRGGIEIEIDTRADHRRKGLATACGARLILACLDRGLYPSWDAHDLRSVALAEKLGYHPAGPYDVYWLDME